MARQTEQIGSGWPILAEEQYIKRHYKSVCAELHFNLSTGIGVNLENEH
jgi:hypothetical protein